MKKSLIIILVLILATFASPIFFYPSLPDSMATHWNLAGQANDYMPKSIGAFLIPFVSIFLLGLFLLVPKIDPLKKNVEKFRNFFDGFIIVLTLFMLYIQSLMLLWNLNFQFNMSTAIIPAMGILFFYIGILLEHSKRNWFIGIRTPWTLSSDKVWEKTNKTGGLLFKICGALTILSLFIQEYALLRAIIPLIVVSLGLVVYSYWEFRKEQIKK